MLSPVTTWLISFLTSSVRNLCRSVPNIAMEVANDRISVAFSEFITKAIIESRDWPVTMRKPWTRIHRVSSVSAAMPTQAIIRPRSSMPNRCISSRR